MSKNCWVADPPIELRLVLTVRLVLAGFAPGVTVTVKRLVFPAATDDGLAAPVPVGLVVGDVTVSEIVALPVRACASRILAGRFLSPAVVLPETVALNEKTPSPAVTSPFAPLSLNACVGDPPMELRLADTEIPVLVGWVPGVTATVSRLVPPAGTVFGLAAATPVGGVGVFTLREIVALPVRDPGAVSVIVAGKLFAPGLVPFETVALKEKTLSPAVASPLRPSS